MSDTAAWLMGAVLYVCVLAAFGLGLYLGGRGR